MDRIDVFPSHEQLHPSQNQPKEKASYLAVWEERRNRVIGILKKHNCRHILDLGCGEGRLFQAMKFMPEFKRLVGIDIDINEISKSYERVGPITYHIFSNDPPEEPLEVALYCGDLTVPYPTLLRERSDAITMVEVIEHLPAEVLERLPDVLFGFYRPEVIIISTPNKEYNQCIKGFDLNTFRHWDHKFEWTRKEFRTWCETQMKKFDGYEVSYQTVGRLHPSAEEEFFGVAKHGRCTQIAVFQRRSGAEGPYNGDLSKFDESTLEVVKSFKFPSKQEIENLKVSHDCSKWDDDEDPDHYEYSEDNTDWDDKVDPEWWQRVWNKEDDDVKAGKGNGQGWDDGDDEPLLPCWHSEDSRIFEKWEEDSKISPDSKSQQRLDGLKDWHHWPEEESKEGSCPEPCSPPSSCRIWSDEEKVSRDEEEIVFPEFSCITSRGLLKKTESCSNERLDKQVSQLVKTREAQNWEFEEESKALDKCEHNLRSHEAVMQKMLGALKFQNSCCS